MDGLTFASKVFDALAWPIVVLVIFLFLKGELLKIFPFLRKLKYKDFEAEFGEGVREISEKLVASPATEPITDAKPNTREHLLRLAEMAPRAAILEAWLKVEHAAQRLISRAGVADRSLRMVGPTIMRSYLDKTAVLTEAQRDSFNKLRDLRNKVVHYVDVVLPLDEVIEYVDLALSLATQLDAEVAEQ